jgi:hypothetical protein
VYFVVDLLITPNLLPFASAQDNSAERVNPSYGTAIETHGDIPKMLPGTTLIIATKTRA